jgi:hypothetical protein
MHFTDMSTLYQRARPKGVMSICIAIGLLVPPLLVYWRGQFEPRALVYVRYFIAVLMVWFIVVSVMSYHMAIRMREAQARGDIDTAIADTGSNVVGFAFGWIPGVIYGLLLAGLRWLWFAFRPQKNEHFVP